MNIVTIISPALWDNVAPALLDSEALSKLGLSHQGVNSWIGNTRNAIRSTNSYVRNYHPYLKKRTQFQKSQVERNFFNNSGLRKLDALSGRTKRTQTNPIFLTPAAKQTQFQSRENPAENRLPMALFTRKTWFHHVQQPEQSLTIHCLTFFLPPCTVKNKNMDDTKTLKTPLDEAVARSLKAGDHVLITGVIYTARDMAHKRLCASIDAANESPFDLEGAIIYFAGPTPARPGRIIGAAGPTTSSRIDTFSPTLIAKGLRAMIGKGYRSAEVRDALKEYGAVHLSAIGGAGALLSRQIVSAEVIAYEDLGTEAIRKLQIVDFPAIVAYDSHGNSVYKE